MEILITANSPGEIAGWTRPIVKCLLEKAPNLNISVLLLPCAFSSGKEKEVAESIKGISRVFTVKQTLSLLAGRKNELFSRPAGILHLGGDIFYGALLSKRLKMPVWAYEWAQKQWDGAYSGYFARDEENLNILLKRKISKEKIHIVGDLLVDSVIFRSHEAEDIKKEEGQMLISLMPGSRLREALALIPLFAAAADMILEDFPSALFRLPISPFIDFEHFKTLFPLSPDKDIEGTTAYWEDRSIRTKKGTLISITQNSMESVKNSDFLITIPGTTTGEAGVLGVPLLSLLPLNKPELLPYIGIIGLLEYIPLIGKPLKRKILLKMSEKKPLLAQPNLRAGRELVPELMDTVNPKMIYERIKPFLIDSAQREKISLELKEMYAPYKGAAEKTAKMILEGLR